MAGGRVQLGPEADCGRSAQEFHDALDPVLLSRLQFFWVISFHILLPAFTVGLACYIAVLDLLYLKTGDHTYFRISVFGPDLCRFVRPWRGFRHCHAVSVRH